jgi:hypothetical protein
MHFPIRVAAAGVLALVWAGCAHQPLAGSDLDRVSRPAFVSRIEENAGPDVTVFRDDSSYKPKLKTLAPPEADRRLRNKLTFAMNRFELSDRLRATTLALLPKVAPWTRSADPTGVARVLQSYLVDEVPANPPDFDLLRPLGVDAVVEFVIERFGMRSENGHAGGFLEGYGRMVLLRDGREVWRRAFRVDQIDSAEPAVDPFAAAKEIVLNESKGTLYRTGMENMVDAVAALFAKDLSPTDRRGGSPVESGQDQGPDSTNKTGRQGQKKDALPPGELPPPDSPL